MVSLLNGLSALGAGVSQFAGSAGLELQKAQLANQSAILADQLATTRETALEGQRQTFQTGLQGQQQTFQAGQNTQTQAAEMARTQATEAGATGRTTLQGQLAATAAQKQQEFELAKANLVASLPTPEEREVQAYTGGAKRGTPEYQKGVRDLGLIKLGADPNTYGAPPVTPPAGGGLPADTTAPTPLVPSPDVSPSAVTTPIAGADATPKGVKVASTSPYLPPVIAAAVQGDSDTPPPAPKPGLGLSYKPIEPGLDKGAPPGGYNERALLGQPEWLVNMVHAINEGRQEPPTPRTLGTVTSLATPEGRAATLLAVYNPQYDAGLYPARVKLRESIASGPIGDGIQAANTVIQHATEFKATAEALNNGQIPLWNWVQNAGLSAAGSPRPSNLAMAVSTLASEARRVYAATGGGTQPELDTWEKSFPTDGSPAQQAGAMTTLVNLLHGKLTAVASRINSGMQTNLSAMDLLNPTARASYAKLATPAAEAAAPTPAETDPINFYRSPSASASPPPPPGFRLVQ